MALVTLEDGRRQLRIPASGSPPTSEHDADIEAAIATAEEVVLDLVNQRRSDGEAWALEVASWDINGSPAVAPPKRVTQAVLMLTGYYFRYRGDDLANEQPTPEYGEVMRAVTNLLYRLRDPALA